MMSTLIEAETTSPNPQPRQPGNSLWQRAADWLNNFQVGWKLSLIFAVLIIGTLAMFITALWSLFTLNARIFDIYNLKLVPIASLSQAESSLINASDQLRALQSSQTALSQQTATFKTIAESEKAFNEVITQYGKDWISTKDADFVSLLDSQGKLDSQKDELATYTSLKNSYDGYINMRKFFQASAEKGIVDKTSVSAALVAIVDVRSRLRHLIELNKQFAEISYQSARLTYERAIMIMSIALGLATLIGLLLSFIVVRSITSRLARITQASRALENGDYQLGARSVVGGKDEIGFLGDAFSGMTTRLVAALTGMEDRVNARTAELQESSTQLAQRASQLEAVSDVSSSIASIREIEKLLPKVAELISQRFGYYHTGIFTLNETSDYAILSAASSEGGKRMMERHHQLRVGPGSLVGFVASRGIPRIALNVEQDAMHTVNPDLPDTRAEMALPLLVGPTLIGVLDVQSTLPGAFSEQDVNVLTTLSNQVAAAIQNARLFTETNQALENAEKIYRQFVQQGWQESPAAAENRGYKYSQTGVEELNPTGGTEKTGDAGYMVPIKLRDHVIGALQITSADGAHEWDADELALIQAAADRAGLALENARLLEESQRRASKERVIGEISSKISAAASTENILKTALGELGALISDTDISIQFISANETPAA